MARLPPTTSWSNALTRRGFAVGTAASAAVSATAGKASTASDREFNMLTRSIPSSGEELPVIGLGTASSFSVTRSDRAALERRKAVIQVLLENGGKIIDTAPSYRGSESVVGDLCRELGVTDSSFLATKVRKEREEAGLDEMNASFNLLHTESIDLIQVHNLVDTDRKLGTMKEWKQEGRYRYVGVTHWRAGIQDALVPVLKSQNLDFVQFQYNIEERGAEETILPAAAENGAATMINVPFGRGRLFKLTNGMEVPEFARDFCSSWAQFYLKFILSHPAVTCVIPATSKPENMADNAGAGYGRLPDSKERQRMIQFVENL